jgi:DUF971 family protein
MEGNEYMNELIPIIKDLWQEDNFTFVIAWTDETQTKHRLNELQKQCPCARCKESELPQVEENVKAITIQSVGRYALKIHFTSGCSLGIYDYEMLYNQHRRKV